MDNASAFAEQEQHHFVGDTAPVANLRTVPLPTEWTDVAGAVGDTALVLISRHRHVDGKVRLFVPITARVVAKREKHGDEVTAISIDSVMCHLRLPLTLVVVGWPG